MMDHLSELEVQQLQHLVQFILSHDNKLEITDSQKEILLNHPTLFKILQDGNKQYARLIFNLKLCGSHSSKSGCQGQCGQLHLCKFFLMSGNCTFVACKFGHDLQSPHNINVLQSQLLHGCSLDQLRLILMSSAPPAAAMPMICKFYNVEVGCSKGSKCHALHICRHYLQDECKFGQACKRSHNVCDDQPKALLLRHGLDVTGNLELVMQELRSAYSSGNSEMTALPSTRSYSVPHVPGDLAPVTSSTTPNTSLPKICKFYNVEAGCSKGPKCHALHVCKHYLQDECSFGQACKRSHNVSNAQPITLLMQHGVDVARSPEVILQELRAAYSPGRSQTITSPSPQKVSDTHEKEEGELEEGEIGDDPLDMTDTLPLTSSKLVNTKDEAEFYQNNQHVPQYSIQSNESFHDSQPLQLQNKENDMQTSEEGSSDGDSPEYLPLTSRKLADLYDETEFDLRGCAAVPRAAKVPRKSLHGHHFGLAFAAVQHARTSNFLARYRQVHRPSKRSACTCRCCYCSQ